MNMTEKTRKLSNKGKFSLYLDKTLMEKIAKISEKKDRSVNYVVEKALASHFSFYPKEVNSTRSKG